MGGGPGGTLAWYEVRFLLDPAGAARRRAGSAASLLRCWLCPVHPPWPPLRKGGKAIARSRHNPMTRNKNTRLESAIRAR